MSSALNGIGGDCAYCASSHPGKCPLVKSIEYHENGNVKRVEFFDHDLTTVQPAVLPRPQHGDWQIPQGPWA